MRSGKAMRARAPAFAAWACTRSWPRASPIPRRASQRRAGQRPGIGIALESIRSAKGRAALTIMGVAIGVAVVVGMASAIQGVNESVVAEFIGYDLRHHNDTLYQNVHRVPPAHVLSFTETSHRHRRYWDVNPAARCACTPPPPG